MKKKVLTSFVLLALFVGVLAQGLEIKAEENNEIKKRIINIGLNGLSNPNEYQEGIEYPASSGTRRSELIYFGNSVNGYNDYLLMDINADEFGNPSSILLQRRNPIDTTKVLYPFHSDGSTYEWSESEIKEYLNTEYYNNNFTEIEKSIILNSFKKEEPAVCGSEMFEPNSRNISEKTCVSNPALTGEKIFLFSASEFMKTKYAYKPSFSGPNTNRDFYISQSTDKYYMNHYTRSNGYYNYADGTKSEKNPMLIDYRGHILRSVSNRPKGILPSLNLDKEKILFNSSFMIKQSIANMEGVQDLSNSYIGEKYNQSILTLKDGNDFSKGASIEKGSETTVLNGGKIEILHKAPASISNTYEKVTAVFTDKNRTVVEAYGGINSDMNATKSTITIPNDLPLGEYNVEIYAEQLGSGFTTDYASGVPFTFSVNIVDKLEEKVTVSYDWLDSGVEGVDLPEAEEIVKDSEYTSKELTVEGYVLDGWYTDQEGKNKFVNGTKINKDTILYGKLKKQIPVTPLEPSVPTENPNIPMVPLEPSIPTEKPTIPFTPLGPSTPSNMTKEPVNTNTVQTGDTTNRFIYIGIMVISMTVVGVITCKKLKKKDE